MGAKAQAYAKFKINIPSSFEQKFPDVVRVFTAEDIGAVCDHKKENNVYPRNNMGSGQPGFPGDTIFAEEEASSTLPLLCQCLPLTRFLACFTM